MTRPNLFLTVSTVAGLLAMLSVPSVSVFAQDDSGPQNGGGPQQGGERRGFGRGGGGGGWHRGGEFDEIKSLLSQDQSAKFDSILKQAMDEGRPMRQQMMQLQSGATDAKTQAKIDDLKAQIREHKKQTKEKLLGILTPDQKAKLSTLKAQRKGGGLRGGDGPALGGGSTPAARGGTNEPDSIGDGASGARE